MFALLVLFALALPLSVKGAHHAYEAALILWLSTVLFGDKAILRQPLVAPMLLYLVFSAVSTALSPDPLLSWDRMKIVGLMLVCVVVAQNLKSLQQIKWIVAALVLGAMLSAGITAWQMMAGIGLEVRNLRPASALFHAGIGPGDTITSINGHRVRTAEQLRTELGRLPVRSRVDVVVLHWAPFQRLTLSIAGIDLVNSGLLDPGAVIPGIPERALGTFPHYAVYAELLLQLSLFTWGLVVAAYSKDRRLAAALLVTFAAMAAALAATKTRSALGALLIAALVVVWLATERRARIASLPLFAVLFLAATLWVHHSRGFKWIDMRDPGTQYRIMIWKDGMHLVKQHPWFGVGMETVRVHWREWHVQAYAYFNSQSHFHSTWVQLAAERGLLALAAWVWFVVAYLVFLARLIRRTRTVDWFAYGIALGTMSAMIGFLIESVVQYNLGEEQVVVTLWFFAALTFAVDRIISADAQAGPALACSA
jgi:O-antigen ligase